MLCHKLPKSIYFRRGAMATAMEDLKEFQRACIITNRDLFQNTPHVKELTNLLSARNIECHVFYEAEDATLTTIRKGADVMKNFEPGTSMMVVALSRSLQLVFTFVILNHLVNNSKYPDVVIAMGGGSALDDAKLMWVLYEHPEIDLIELSFKFKDIRQRLHEFPKMNIKAQLVCIPTASGSGSEVTPFAVMTDDMTRQKYPVANYALTPQMAIIDANLVMTMPKDVTAEGGMDTITHAMESYASINANEFSDGQALQALKLLKTYLPRAYQNGREDPVAREKVHNASTIAGIAFANSSLGICHSLAHAVGDEFRIPHGIANALILTNVIRFNMSSKQHRPNPLDRYGEISMHLGFAHTETLDRANAMLEWLDELKHNLDIPMSIQEWGIEEAKFLSTVDRLAADALEDPCTGTNPRYPGFGDLRQILLDSFYGRSWEEQGEYE
jgi:acetaldehyde dehydrogenase/alcohol dehydrogenase